MLKVTISVKKGTAEIEKLPPGIELTVIDHDGEQRGEGTDKRTYVSTRKLSTEERLALWIDNKIIASSIIDVLKGHNIKPTFENAKQVWLNHLQGFTDDLDSTVEAIGDFMREKKYKKQIEKEGGN